MTKKFKDIQLEDSAKTIFSVETYLHGIESDIRILFNRLIKLEEKVKNLKK